MRTALSFLFVSYLIDLFFVCLSMCTMICCILLCVCFLYLLFLLLHSTYSFVHGVCSSVFLSVHLPCLSWTNQNTDKDHASTSDLSAPSLASAAVVMENQLMRSGLEAVLAETEAVVDGAVSAVLSGGRNKRLATDSEKALSEAIELPPPTAGNIIC